MSGSIVFEIHSPHTHLMVQSLHYFTLAHVPLLELEQPQVTQNVPAHLEHKAL